MLLKVVNPVIYVDNVLSIFMKPALLLNNTSLIFRFMDEIRWFVEGYVCVCEDLCLILILILIFMEFEVWLPQPFHVLRGRSKRLFTFVDPAKDHRLETHLGQKSSDHS